MSGSTAIVRLSAWAIVAIVPIVTLDVAFSRTAGAARLHAAFHAPGEIEFLDLGGVQILPTLMLGLVLGKCGILSSHGRLVPLL